MRHLVMIVILMGTCLSLRAQDNSEKSDITVSSLNPALDPMEGGQLYLRSFRGSAKIITKDEFERINSDEIDYIQVLNDERSTYIYGDKGKNGVVLVVMKVNSLSQKFSTRKRRQK